MAAAAIQSGINGYAQKKDQLSLVMQRHGIEWEKKDTRKAPVCIRLQKEQRAKEIAALEATKTAKEGEVAEQEQRLKELAPAVKNMERLAADFSANPEQILPEAGALETGRSYREKKGKTVAC